MASANFSPVARVKAKPVSIAANASAPMRMPMRVCAVVHAPFAGATDSMSLAEGSGGGRGTPSEAAGLSDESPGAACPHAATTRKRTTCAPRPRAKGAFERRPACSPSTPFDRFFTWRSSERMDGAQALDLRSNRGSVCEPGATGVVQVVATPEKPPSEVGRTLRTLFACARGIEREGRTGDEGKKGAYLHWRVKCP